MRTKLNHLCYQLRLHLFHLLMNDEIKKGKVSETAKYMKNTDMMSIKNSDDVQVEIEQNTWHFDEESSRTSIETTILTSMII